MAQFNPVDYPHYRYNPLTGPSVLVSLHCAKRPWQGSKEVPSTSQLPTNDPLMRCESVHGTSWVIYFSPEHNENLPKLPLPALEEQRLTWPQQTAEFAKHDAWVPLSEQTAEHLYAISDIHFR